MKALREGIHCPIDLDHPRSAPFLSSLLSLSLPSFIFALMVFAPLVALDGAVSCSHYQIATRMQRTATYYHPLNEAR
jgi:hypothetical protein